MVFYVHCVCDVGHGAAFGGCCEVWAEVEGGEVREVICSFG